MSNYNAIRNVLTQLSGQDNILTVPKVYVRITGDMTTAILLNQIVFWSDKTTRTDGYFYKTYAELEKEILLTERQIRYSAKKLKLMNLIDTKVMRANGKPTVHYKLHVENLINFMTTKCQKQNRQNVRNETDKMSETKTDKMLVSETDKMSDSITYDNTYKYTDDYNINNNVELSFKSYKFYNDNFSPLNEFMSKKIKKWCDDLNDDLVLHAMKLSLENNVQNFSYVEAILKNWLEKEITTVEQAIADKEKFIANRKKQQKNNKSKDIVPDWFEEHHNQSKQTTDEVDFDYESEKRRLEEKFKNSGGG